MKFDGTMLSALIAVVAVGATVFGWTVVNRQNVKRDLANERREQRMRYLVNTYHDIARTANREMSDEEARRMEEAIMSVQLFGTKKQIEAIEAMHQPNNGDWTSVLETLRDYLHATSRTGFYVLAMAKDTVVLVLCREADDWNRH